MRRAAVAAGVVGKSEVAVRAVAHEDRAAVLRAYVLGPIAKVASKPAQTPPTHVS